MELIVSVLDLSWHVSEAFTPYKGVWDGFSKACCVAYLVSAGLYVGLADHSDLTRMISEPYMGSLITLIR